MLRAIVFDFDGVIANSEPLHFRAFRDVLAEEGVTLTEADYYARVSRLRRCRRVPGDRRGRGDAWTPAHIGGLVARKAVRLEALERDVSVLFPGAAAAIRRAAAAVPIAIASGARGAEIRRVLERESLIGCFTRDRRRRRHAGQQAGARSVPARGGRCCGPRAAAGSPRPTASRSRTRGGASSRRAPPGCARSA